MPSRPAKLDSSNPSADDPGSGERRCARARVRLPAAVRARNLQIHALCVELGTGGAFIEAPMSPQQGTAVRVELGDLLMGDTVVVGAVVRWRTHWGFGVQFSNIGVRGVKALARILSEHRVVEESPRTSEPDADWGDRETIELQDAGSDTADSSVKAPGDTLRLPIRTPGCR